MGAGVSHGAGSRGRRAAHERHARSPTRRGAWPGARGAERSGEETSGASGAAPFKLRAARARGRAGGGRGRASPKCTQGRGAGGGEQRGGAGRGGTRWGRRRCRAARPGGLTGRLALAAAARRAARPRQSRGQTRKCSAHALRPPRPLACPAPSPPPRFVSPVRGPHLAATRAGARARGAPEPLFPTPTHTHTHPAAPRAVTSESWLRERFLQEGNQKKKRKLYVFFFSPEWVQEARPGKPPPAARAEARGLNPAALRTPRLCLLQRGARKNCFKICFKILFTCPCAILFFFFLT